MPRSRLSCTESVCPIVAGRFVGAVYLSLRAKNRLNRELSMQKKKLEEQKTQLIQQKELLEVQKSQLEQLSHELEEATTPSWCSSRIFHTISVLR